MAIDILYGMDNFKKEVLESKLPVLIDFYGEGCAPCEALEPILEDLAEELDGKLIVKKYKVETSEIRTNAIIKEYKVMSFPTLLVFKDGEHKKRIIGYRSKEDLIKALEGIL